MIPDVQYSTVQYSRVQYGTVQYSIVQYSYIGTAIRGALYSLSYLLFVVCM